MLFFKIAFKTGRIAFKTSKMQTKLGEAESEIITIDLSKLESISLSSHFESILKSQNKGPYNQKVEI